MRRHGKHLASPSSTSSTASGIAASGRVANTDYKRQVVNALLECLDPVDGRQGVVVVGATNDAAAVDPALLRPGRLEKTIVIGLPDGPTRAEILRHTFRMPRTRST